MNRPTHRINGKMVHSPIPVSFSDLPPKNLKRWSWTIKAKVVLAVRQGTVTTQYLRDFYNISLDEFFEWDRGYAEGGPQGTKVANHRRKVSRYPKRRLK